MNIFFKLSGTLLLIILCQSIGFAQDCTTTADDTWNCGSPAESSNLIVNHAVTISSTFKATGNITINAGGSLTITEDFDCVGCIITVFSGGTLVIEGNVDLESQAYVNNQGTIQIGESLTLKAGSTLTSEGSILVRDDMHVDEGATLLIAAGSKTYVMDDLEINSSDVTINGRIHVVGKFTNNQSISGTGQVSSKAECGGSGTINGEDATVFCNTSAFDSPNVLCGPDTVAPAIANMPLDTTLYAPKDACEIAFSWETPVAADNCALQSLTSTHNPGQLFAIGTTQVTYTAVDESNNTFSASFSITVIDSIAPTISNVPVNITQYVEGAACGAAISWTLPTATDNCTLQEFTYTHNPGDYFEVGTTAVTFTAVDDAQNVAVASFNIIIKDNITPSISNLPGNIVAYADANSCGTTVDWPLPVATDNCSSISLTATNDPGDFFEVGTTQVIYTAADASNNTILATFNVVVMDTISPKIVGMPATTTSYIEDGSCGAIVDWVPPGATDNCTILSFSSTNNPGDFFEAGTTKITYTAVDEADNVTIASFEVIVKDTVMPNISNVPEDITQYVDASANGVTVQWAMPTATDNCLLVSFTASSNSGDLFPIGATEVTYTATDISDNSVTASFIITVLDTIPPVLTNMPEIIARYADPGSCGATIDWAPPTATDNGSTPSLVSTNQPGEFFKVGTTLVSYTAMDEAQNEVTASFEIIIKDTIAPKLIEMPEDMTLYAGVDACGTHVDWVLPTIVDDCSVSLDYRYDPGSFFEVGTTSVTFTAVDAAENITIDSFSITVIDTLAPTMHLPEDIIVYAGEDSCGAIVDWIAPDIVDNCSLDSITYSHIPGDFFAVDTTTVIYAAIDAAQNEVIDSFKVIVIDTLAPGILNMPENIVQMADAGACGARISWAPPTVMDNCSATLTSSHNPGDFYKLGTTVVTYAATDIHGNATSASFEIIVRQHPEDQIQLAFNDTTIALGTSVQLLADGSGVSYRWEPQDYLDHPGIQNPFATPTQSIIYTVIMETSSGCIDKQQVTVHVRAKDSYFIPEMFTPDGDGVNDILFVNTVGYGALDFKLFNRFGHLVFSTNDTDIGWDGKINGQLQKPDTYVYTLVLQVSADEYIKEKGTVQLVR